VAVMLVISAGFLSYRSLSSVVALIYSDAKPDYQILTLKTISSDLEKAENSIRIYTLTKNESLLKPYYSTISTVDDKIDLLRDECQHNPELLSKIDTISKLIENKFVVWGQMLKIYNDGNIEIALKKLSDDISNKPDGQKNILKNFFKEQQESDLNNKNIAKKIIDIEKSQKLKVQRIKLKEIQLAKTNDLISNQFYSIIEQLENSEREKIKERALVANQMANRTYHLLTWFSVGSTALALIVLFIVGRYVRKTFASQKALEKSKIEAENLANAKELFMANVSHEIRTPLNALAGFLEQILDEPLNEDVKEKLKIVKSSSDHLNHIISDILDFSKLQSGKMKMENIHFRIDKVMHEIFILFESQARLNGNRLLYEPCKDKIPVILGDPFRLQQILNNLLSNAIKFTHYGEVRFSSEVVEVSNAHVKIAIQVADNGIGIPQEKFDKVFEDFTQAGPEVTRKYGGTGLGLSIVKKLVELHQGEIIVKSEPNKGTSITCYLEYALGNEEKIDQPIINKLIIPENIQKLKVLVVDDEEYNRMLIHSIFRKWNVQCTEAANGLDAIEQLKLQPYDLILMDSRMPVLDGIKATKFIRNNMDQSKAKVPIITVTAAVLSSDMEKYSLSGANAVLEKPFSEESLLNTITHVINHQINNSHDVILSPKDFDTERSEPDFKELYRLTGDDPAFIREMLNKFIETTNNGLQSMSENLVNGNIEQVMQLAHKLSSPCRHLGAHKLLLLLKQIENEFQPHDTSTDLKEMIQKANSEYDTIKQRVIEHLNSLA
jgi:signal transduction histidine kinase/CheY-like chemotaxis protein/HPt (histidine-containing phosphotransfer) domain-containing protein